jgi:hypothetical protein
MTVGQKMGLHGSQFSNNITCTVTLPGVFDAKRLSAVYSAEAESWRPKFKDNQQVQTDATRLLITQGRD